LRDAHPALSRGGSFVRLAREGVLVVSRIDRESRREYLVAFNAGDQPTRVSAQTATPNAGWALLFGPGSTVSSNRFGRATIRIPPLSALVYRAERAEAELPRRGRARVTLNVAPDRFTNLIRLGATPQSVDPLSVTFAVRRGGSWRRLGTDDGAPYRVFIDPRDYRRGARVSFVAAVLASDGSVSASRVVTTVVRR
jgi:hypothetical protein